MYRLKILSILAGMIVVLAVSAAPASAWWESNTGQTQGTVMPIRAPEVILGKGEGATTFRCITEEIKAIWYLQTKGQIKEHQKNGKQEPTTKGPHLHIQIKSWGKGCTAKIDKETFVVEISSCELQWVQAKGSFTATAGFVTGCLLKFGTTKPPLCEIQIPPGMEKAPESNEGINVGLREVSLENIGKNQLDIVNVKESILANSIGTNALCPLAKSFDMSIVGFELEAEGIKAV